MNYWHMQLHPDEKSEWTTNDIRKILKFKMIGCSGPPISEFQKIKKNDIIIIRHGGEVLALVKVITIPEQTPTELKNDYIWFDYYVKVEILEEYQNEYISGKGWYIPITLQIIDNKIAYDYVQKLLKKNFTRMKLIEFEKKIKLLKYKKQIILQGPPGTGKTREAKLIAKEILGLNSTDDLKDNEQFKLIQFHPSYTYEDFVRGIVAESKGDKIEYKNVNKTLGEFAELALKNYNDSKKNVNELSTEKWIDDEFTQFVDEISQTLEKEKIVLSDNVDLVDLMDDAFLYIGENWKGYEHRMSFKDIKRAYLDNNLTRQDIVKNMNLSGSARQHATYYIVVLKKFREFLSGKKAPINQTKINEQKYILVIDEINRANLSSVLGELIYALEYRGKAVESMYSVENSILNNKNQLILPDNLYIIGTMNTSDRSVGHIDYAIRRRFAFVEVLPEKLKDNDEIFFNTSDFIDVAKLFIKVGEDQVLDFEKAENSDFLSDDFSAKDVALGHSYFIAEKKKISEDNKQEYFNMKMKYEVIPILNEYLKDGVFNEKATVKIKEIEQRFA